MATKMRLADFYGYVRANRKRISDIYREIEEIQYQFNELYAQLGEKRNTRIAALVPQLLPEASADLPPQLQQLLRNQVQLERKAIEQEIATLTIEVAQKRQKADQLIQDSQRQVAYLREQNPILDQQEEELKARAAAIESEIQETNVRLKSLSWFPIGWLSNFFKRRNLRREREQLEDNLEAVKDGVRKVREKWQAEKTRLQEAQTDLKGEWQAVSVEVSQAQARLDYLSTNIDQESLRNAAWRLLSELKEVPVNQGAWSERLSPLVEFTRSKVEYEAGLRSVAEILGLLKGLGEGMDRFIRSVGTVYEEQRRYKLPSLTVRLSDAVTSFHSIWPDFQAKVKDEKYLGLHPLEFERRIKELLPARLGEAAIQKMFEDMGEALSQATKAWR
jgi:DNA repair exonuclease SbcCD ATPase subunit